MAKSHELLGFKDRQGEEGAVEYGPVDSMVRGWIENGPRSLDEIEWDVYCILRTEVADRVGDKSTGDYFGEGSAILRETLGLGKTAEDMRVRKAIQEASWGKTITADIYTEGLPKDLTRRIRAMGHIMHAWKSGIFEKYNDLSQADTIGVEWDHLTAGLTLLAQDIVERRQATQNPK